MPYEVSNTIFEDDCYGLFNAIDNQHVYIIIIQITERLQTNSRRSLTPQTKNRIEKRKEELRIGHGLDCPYYEAYRPLGNIKPLYNLKVEKVDKKRKEIIKNDDYIKPLPPNIATLSPKRKYYISDTGYKDINNALIDSNTILKYVKSGKSYFQYLKHNSIEERMKWIGDTVERDSINTQVIDEYNYYIFLEMY